MKKSDVFRAIVKIQEYCNKQVNCNKCELLCVDGWDEEVCSMYGRPDEWLTNEIPLNVLGKETED